ncbi:helix-turn-helix domain-containing protein [Cupriavidus sp. D39]|uniref:helix-turn-helix domain-containing protein n=1 Tax=Cupriavidus sp. D39 TaxID=2997877 RepID=UPI0022701F13|nr:helix-turn-helix domain-containing protein [Cupriavidus sp. D39]MCY0853805.1 helix-turn-helix domain-containing protein [Cupriavidus sp. D39]
MTQHRLALPQSAQEPERAASLPHTRFEVGGAAGLQSSTGQILAWRDRVGHVIDLDLTKDQVASPFAATIDRYLVEDMVFTDCRCDGVSLHRTLARISTDAMRHYVFQVFIGGNAGRVEGLRRNPMPRQGGILLTDLGQPARMVRDTSHALTFFVPRAVMESIFPEAESAHGRMVEANTSMTILAVGHVTALARDLPRMTPERAARELREAIQLLVAAFRKAARLEDDARSATRNAMLAHARRLIAVGASQPHLSPNSLLVAMNISRPTLYRLFEQEGGVHAYIRKIRLRAASAELVQFPNLPVVEIAFGLGFSSASDFTRAFRRTYGMSPSDLRVEATNPQREDLMRAALKVQGLEYEHWLRRHLTPKDWSVSTTAPTRAHDPDNGSAAATGPARSWASPSGGTGDNTSGS